MTRYFIRKLMYVPECLLLRHCDDFFFLRVLIPDMGASEAMQTVGGIMGRIFEE